MIAKSFADVAKFDEVARVGPAAIQLWDSLTHVRSLLLMSLSAEAKQIFCSTGFSLWGLVQAGTNPHRLQAYYSTFNADDNPRLVHLHPIDYKRLIG